MSALMDTLLRRTQPGHVSLRDLNLVLDVQGMSLDELLRKAADCADECNEEGRDLTEQGEAALAEARQVWRVAQDAALTTIEEGTAKVALAARTQRVLARLLPAE